MRSFLPRRSAERPAREDNRSLSEWQVDLELEPKGIQSTISIKAKGDVVVQFGNMRHPPFDTTAARDELRLALNEMDGVHIPSRGLRWWPRFPISVLEDPANLSRLVAVLDRIATDSP